MHDLNVIANYVFEKWKHVSSFACSLGAYFSLNTYVDTNFDKRRLLFEEKQHLGDCKLTGRFA
ncbi:hypothetical protein JOC37_000377 [Desulfohalotomaculum tongense]|nr:hypothetical protein [Desulforadius tongensis]